MFVMAGLLPAIHVFTSGRKSWMPGTRPGMTMIGLRGLARETRERALTSNQRQKMLELWPVLARGESEP
jgi:hypothetical protein